MSKKWLFLTMLPLASCGDPIKVGAPPPPAEWMTCAEMPARPDLSPLEAITLPDGRVVYSKPATDARDAAIARWVVEARGAWFSCSTNLAKVRDYHAGE
jgi:hypothetical protein